VTREELEHAIRAACDVADDSAVYVFGSQAILGEHPDAPAELRQSAEVDMTPVTRPDQIDRVDGALGELSSFHQEHGFYVHGLPIENTAVLPPGWKDRVVHVSNANTNSKLGLCLEGHDLAASKLAAFREKDQAFVRTLLVRELIDPTILRQRLALLDMPATELNRRTMWVDLTAQDLRQSP
jgi:hypothetical protein